MLLVKKIKLYFFLQKLKKYYKNYTDNFNQKNANVMFKVSIFYMWLIFYFRLIIYVLSYIYVLILWIKFINALKIVRYLPNLWLRARKNYSWIIPSTIVTILSILFATFMSWVTTIIVLPCFCKSLSSSMISLAVLLSSAEVGSSASTTSGALTMALAMATLCFCPPERSRTFLFFSSVIFKR